ncbi:hypothetical protein D9M71_504540 [compost metagenome]
MGGRQGQQVLILPQHRQVGSGRCVVGELDIAFDGSQARMNLLDQGQEVFMHQHQVILGVIHGVEHLLR